MLKVIIAGGREFSDYNLLAAKCDRFLKGHHPDIEVVCGKARGADALGEQYAKERGYSIKPFPADWNRLGNGAGFVRNHQMGDYADVLIAFWDGESSGTADMIECMEKQGKPVRIVRY